MAETSSSETQSEQLSVCVTSMYTYCNAIGVPLTLLKLKTMKGADGKPLKIVQKIAAHDYTTFGMCLLQDENGEEVVLLKKKNIHDGPESVTEAIIRKWLTSDAPTRTYQHLIECLRQSELGGLAELIENTTGIYGQSTLFHVMHFYVLCRPKFNIKGTKKHCECSK